MRNKSSMLHQTIIDLKYRISWAVREMIGIVKLFNKCVHI